MQQELIFKLLKFNQKWFDLGLLNEESSENLIYKFENSEDKNTEHYRWKIFKDFLDMNSKIEEKKMYQIYELCKNEPDNMLQDSMIHSLIRRSDFPLDLLIKESYSDIKSISKVATEKLNLRKQN